MRNRSHQWTLALTASFLLAVGPVVLSGQEGEPLRFLDIDSYLEMESVGAPQISPDGRHVLFTRGWIDKMADRTRSNLWIADTDGSRLRRLTGGAWNDFSPAWSPDGKRIAFLSDRDGSAQIHVMWLDTRESSQLTHLEETPGTPHWSPDGRTLAFGMRVPDTDPILPVRLPKFPAGAELAPPAKVIDRIIFAYDGWGDLPRGEIHLFTVDAEVGGTPRQVTATMIHVASRPSSSGPGQETESTSWPGWSLGQRSSWRSTSRRSTPWICARATSSSLPIARVRIGV